MNSLENLDWNELLQVLSEHGSSLTAKKNLQSLNVKETESEACQDLERIGLARRLVSLSAARPTMSSLDLYPLWHLRLKKGATLTTLEIKDIRLFLDELLALNGFLQKLDSREALVPNDFFDPEDLLNQIDKVITLSGEIRSDASPALFHFFKEREELNKKVSSSLDRLVKDNKMEPVLQERFVTTRRGRFVVPVKGGAQHGIKGAVQARSQSKQTVFIEPEEILPLNNRLQELEYLIEEEIERILKELSAQIYRELFNIETSFKKLLFWDELLAKAQFSEELELETPLFSESSFNLINLKHPLLFLQSKNLVPNSLTLNSEKRVLILSGPNAGGKTVLLKSIGLAAQLARCGLPIPAAKGSELPFFTKILISIGDSQSVDENLSTFAAHLKILNQGTLLSGPQELLLVDEICGSTDPEEGAALAKSFVEVFGKNKIFAVITSHLGSLKRAFSAESGIMQGSMHFDAKNSRPSYHFFPGIAGDSLAIETARRVGTNAALIQRAIELLSPEMRLERSLMDELEQKRSDLNILMKSLEQKEKVALEKEKKYEELLKSFEAEKERALSKLVQEAQREIKNELALAKTQDLFKKHQALEQSLGKLPELIKHKPTAEEAIQTAEEFIKKFPPGTRVFIKSLKQYGVIQGEPNHKAEIPILAESLRLFVHWKDLVPAAAPHKPSPYKVYSSQATPDKDPQIDLRGESVEDALSKLEDFLDQMAVTHGSSVRIQIIHGHGTDALKRAIRSYLTRSEYVKKWQTGAESIKSGGDGVTWVELN